MLFNSLDFLLFFPIVCITYYAISNNRLRNCFLLVASYYFYMKWNVGYALLLLGSTILTYISAIGISIYHRKFYKKLCLIFCVVTNLSVLFVFKYLDFFVENVNALLSCFGSSTTFSSYSLLLPVGISFYIFQALGYAVDVYRGNVKVELNFFRYALFVSFFPQLVAGPIERSSNLLPQFRTKHSFNYESAMVGVNLMIWGFFLKLVLADRCAIYVDTIYNNLQVHNGGSYILAALLFTFQIYGDFAGYSLIAIGAAKIMGFELMNNFDTPYFSSTITNFWKRWHISLSTWFRDYLYIPLGGNRVSNIRNYLNIMITFLVSGLWHGANWTFVFWGGIHGFMQCFEKYLGWQKKRFYGLPKFIHCIFTFLIVCFAWIFFRAETLNDAFTIIYGIINDIGIPYIRHSCLLFSCVAIILLLLKEVNDKFHLVRLSSSPYWIIRHAYIVVMITYILLFGILNGGQFIYFQF